MVSIDQVEFGLARWMDKELVPKIPTGGAYDGLKKAATVAVGLYAIKRIRSALTYLAESDFLNTIGATTKEGHLDVEGFAEEMRKQIPEEGLRVSVPMVGDMTFYRGDLDDIVRYIKS